MSEILPSTSVVTVSVIIPSYNSVKTIRDCLDNLLQQSTSVNYEIIVVDSSDDNTRDVLEKYKAKVNVIYLDNKTSPGQGRNIGVKHASGQLLLFTDSDCMPNRDWVQRNFDLCKKHSIVGGSVVNGRPEFQISWAEYYIEFREFSANSPERTVDFVPTCNLAIRKSAFDQVGGFPEIRASEDVLFSFKLRELGFCVHFNPQNYVRHLNRYEKMPYLNNQKMLGYNSAIARKTYPLPGASLVKYPYLHWLLPFVRSVRTLMFLLKGKSKISEVSRFLRCFHWFFLGAIWWTKGFYNGSIEVDK